MSPYWRWPVRVRATAPKPDEPQYDLAWETPHAVWVAEVKSLTTKNELRE
jgi:hypothetical protein